MSCIDQYSEIQKLDSRINEVERDMKRNYLRIQGVPMRDGGAGEDKDTNRKAVMINKFLELSKSVGINDITTKDFEIVSLIKRCLELTPVFLFWLG